MKYRSKARGRCSSLLVAALTVSLLSGCNLGLQPRGVDSGSSSGVVDSRADTATNPTGWLEWPTSSADAVTSESNVTLRGCSHLCDGGGGNGSGSSGRYDFNPVSSKKIATDVGPGLDTEISGGLDVNIPIRRYVGDYRSILAGTLSEKALLKFTIHTTDPAALSCTGVDKLFLNGHSLGSISDIPTLDSNDYWTVKGISIPIQNLKVPINIGDTANNSFRIDVNTNGCSGWAIKIDWAKITFDAGPVVVFVHGILSGGEVWNSFKSKMTTRGVVSDNSITMPYDDFNKNAMRDPALCDIEQFTSTTINSAKIVTELQRIARLYGTGEFAMVGHSKGGMDGKAAILQLNTVPQVEVGTTGSQIVREPVIVKNLITINTPHLGTPAGDLGILKTLEENNVTKIPGEFNRILEPVPWNYAFVQGQIVGKLLSKNHVCDLTTNKATTFNGTNPIGVPVFGTNTDAPSNPPNLNVLNISNFGQWTSTFGLNVWQRLYNYVGNTQKLTLTEDHSTAITLYTVNQTTQVFESNDILVSRTSAGGSGIRFVVDRKTGIHHTAVIDRTDVQEIIISAALADPAGTFGVSWRK